MAGALETLAYAIARGVARAWFDELDERQLAEREVPDVSDRVRARLFRDAVSGVRKLPAGDPGPVGPSPGSPGN